MWSEDKFVEEQDHQLLCWHFHNAPVNVSLDTTAPTLINTIISSEEPPVYSLYIISQQWQNASTSTKHNDAYQVCNVIFLSCAWDSYCFRLRLSVNTSIISTKPQLSAIMTSWTLWSNVMLYRKSLVTSTCTLGCSQGMRQHHIA